MLEALYPGRIDLGIGRAPGGDQMTALAMGEGRYPGAERFTEQVQYLVAYLDGALPKEHPFAGVKIMLEGPTAPQVWLLELRERFQADELMAITITGDYDSRLKSYELLAEAFGLTSAGQRD